MKLPKLYTILALLRYIIKHQLFTTCDLDVSVLVNTVLFMLLYVLYVVYTYKPVAEQHSFECCVVRTNSILMGTSPMVARRLPVLWFLNAFLSATHHLSPRTVFTFVCRCVIRVAHCPKEACSHAVPSDHFLFQDPTHQ